MTGNRLAFEITEGLEMEMHSDILRCISDLKLLGVALPEVTGRMPSIDFVAAQRLIHAATGEDVLGEPDLAPAHERWLGEWALRERGSDFLFVTGFPMAKRPFYTHPDPERPEYTNGFDLLFRGLELVTGGQRLHRYEDYLAALSACGKADIKKNPPQVAARVNGSEITVRQVHSALAQIGSGSSNGGPQALAAARLRAVSRDHLCGAVRVGHAIAAV